jgi:hypothetical protein
LTSSASSATRALRCQERTDENVATGVPRAVASEVIVFPP